jgi:tripartite-type tricarboxylate transporter receptor subunit TctC
MMPVGPAQSISQLSGSAGASAALLLAAFAFAAAPTHAQSGKPAGYPTKTVRMIVAYPAGGSADLMTRVLAQKLGERIGQQVVVDNRPGAAGNIGVEAVAKSAADGYTLLLGAIGSHSVAMSYYAKINFDLRTDFAPISMAGTTTNIVVVHPALPVRNVKDLIALARARPGELNFASSGTGGLIHLTGEMFKQAAKVDLVHVPYKGTALFLPDLLKGQIAMAFDTLAPHLPFIKAGKLRGVAVTAGIRTPLLPEVPTVAESGLPGFESVASYALLVPAGTPKDVVAYLNRETVAALQSADLKDRLSAAGIDPLGSSPEELERIIRAEIAKWARVIKAAGITPE